MLIRYADRARDYMILSGFQVSMPERMQVVLMSDLIKLCTGVFAGRWMWEVARGVWPGLLRVRAGGRPVAGFLHGRV